MSVVRFEFRAIDASGAVQTGVTRAATWDDAYRRVAASGLTPLRIRPARRWCPRGGRRGIGLRDLSLFTYQFSVLMEARLPIGEALRSIAEEEANQTFRDIILSIASSIEAGSTIIEAIDPHREVFGDVYIETLRAAEQSGNLVQVLEHLAQVLDHDIEMRQTMRSALIYPACVLVALAGAVVFLMLVVVPRFEGMFAERGVDLPAATRILIGSSRFVSTHWWMLAGAFALGGATVWRLQSTPRGRLILDRLLHRLPILRGALQAIALSRFAHVLGLSLSSGLSLIDCLVMSGRASGRPQLLDDAWRLADQVSQGGRLADALPHCPYFTGFVRRLLSAGEQTAEMSRMCRIVAHHYDREVRYLAKNVATIIEPFVIVVLAAVVLMVALGIFLPMWNLMAVMG